MSSVLCLVGWWCITSTTASEEFTGMSILDKNLFFTGYFSPTVVPHLVYRLRVWLESQRAAEYTRLIGWEASSEWFTRHTIGLWVSWAATAVNARKAAPVKTEIPLFRCNNSIRSNRSGSGRGQHLGPDHLKSQTSFQAVLLLILLNILLIIADKKRFF